MSNMKDMPAFPCGCDVTLNQYEPSSGMTLRDYFAAKAITGTLPGDKADEKILAQWAYRMADAMMEARK